MDFRPERKSVPTLTDLARLPQRRLGAALRARVAGDDAAERAKVIWGRPGERWFTPQDPVWRVHADASMFPGGVAALLLQSLHPLAMAGVAGHSGYRGDPWGRLQRTSRFIAMTTFGPTNQADALIRRIRRIHDTVNGTAPDGRPYAASDPHLLSWVHLTEVDCFLRSFERYGSSALTPAEADEYVAQAGRIASELGALEVPATVAEVAAMLQAYRPELRGTPAARGAAR